jgi:hypothetical protein
MVRMGSGRSTRAIQGKAATTSRSELAVLVARRVHPALTSLEHQIEIWCFSLRACSARSTTVKCSTLLYLNGGPVLTCPPFTGRRYLSGRPQATDLAICFVQIVSRNVCVCYSARRWPPVRRSIDKKSARRHGREKRSVNVIPTESGSQVDVESVGGLAPPGQLRRPIGRQFPRRRREHDQVRVDP